MAAPEQAEAFVELAVEGLRVFVARDIWASLKPGQSKLLVAVPGFGRFWLHLRQAGPGE